MSAFTDLANRADGTRTPEEIKAALPVAYVLEQAGFPVSSSREDGKLTAPCPFHTGNRGLDIFPGGDRWGCFPCAIPGEDVLDLLSRLHGIEKFSEQVAYASRMIDNMDPAWVPPLVSERRNLWDQEAAEAVILSASVADDTPIGKFLAEKSLGSPALAAVTVDFLRDSWLVGANPQGEIVIPYYTRENTLVAYKHRTAGTKPLSAPGSTLSGVLYGEWRDSDLLLPVLLCEGESDCWAASAALPEYAVLGLPAGAGGHPSAARSLAGRRVVLAFDADDSGEAARKKWATALLAEGCTVEMVRLPEGRDLCEVHDLRRTVETTRHLKPSPDKIKEEGDTYVRPGREVNTMLTNWRFVADTELSGPSGLAYEGVLLPGGLRTTISGGDLSSKTRIVSWCARRGLSWLGSDGDAQQLSALLQHQGPYLAAGSLVNYAGLFGESFVWPEHRIGSDPVVYAPPSFDVGLDRRISVERGRYTAAQVTELRNLHTTAVMDPFLAWLAVAPLRSTLEAFPILAITGSSGSGKTTLIDTVVQAFTGSSISTNLTSTTKHAVASLMACTNSFPVWFDEYRPGARKDTLLAFEQLLRDAYTGQVSSKGGLGEHWSEVTAMDTHAPIIVSGEDTFTETSHTERMVNLALPSEGKNPAALQDVSQWGPTGFAHAYLTFLSRLLLEEALTCEPAGDESLPARQRANLGVLHLGWSLLTKFCNLHNLDLPAADFSLVERIGMETSGHNPIKDALLWALEEPEAYSFMRRDPEAGLVYLREHNFVTFVTRAGTFTLPGKTEAIRRFLIDAYEGYPSKADFGGKTVSCLALQASLIE